MPSLDLALSRLFAVIVEHIDIPRSYYEKSASRHRCLGEWLQRPDSKVAAFDPEIRPQGSFRFGTVIRPIRPDEEYDLDDVCELKLLSKNVMSQRALKKLYGAEIKAYARANNILAPVEECNRCWRLRYADEVEFHLDTLPCVPEEHAVVQHMIRAGAPLHLARHAVGITDKRHPSYDQITLMWISSNPQGFAVWFEERAALGRVRSFAPRGMKAMIEDVPPYDWKTPLQRGIQLLKRHRDVMFLEEPDLAPISMIITNLAARAYEGETDLATALFNMVQRMPEFVRPTAPRVPNPADPLEDYADKWSRDPRLERNFWAWHTAVKADLAKLVTFLQRGTLESDIQRLFCVDLTQAELRLFNAEPSIPASPVRHVAPAIAIASAPKPWGANG